MLLNVCVVECCLFQGSGCCLVCCNVVLWVFEFVLMSSVV